MGIYSDTSDDIDACDLDCELDLLTYMNKDMILPDTDSCLFFYLTLHCEVAKEMSPCIIWIPNIHDLNMEE